MRNVRTRGGGNSKWEEREGEGRRGSMISYFFNQFRFHRNVWCKFVQNYVAKWLREFQLRKNLFLFDKLVSHDIIFRLTALTCTVASKLTSSILGTTNAALYKHRVRRAVVRYGKASKLSIGQNENPEKKEDWKKREEGRGDR